MSKSLIVTSCNSADGEGHVEFSPEFSELPPVTRADILKDLIVVMRAEYIKALADMRNANEYEGPRLQ